MTTPRRLLAVLVADVRGRGSSEGVFDPFRQEARDGYDTVEWIATQPWSDGRVGMMGGSYGGFNQWTIAKEFPPHLVTITPTASSYLGIDFPTNGGIGSRYEIQWISLTSGRTGNTNLFGDQSYWARRFREHFRAGLAFASLDSLVGFPSTTFQDWAAHPDYDDYWRVLAPSPAQLNRLSLPILTRNGIYDADQVGAMEYYREHMRRGNAEARARHYLVIGPWDQGGTRDPTRDYLTSPGDGAGDVFRSGTLVSTQPPASAPDTWRYDPLDISAAAVRAPASRWRYG